MDARLRPLKGPEEMEGFERARSCAFGEAFDATSLASFAVVAEPDRMVVATEADDIVGTAAAFSFQMSVPGGADLATAGVKAVSVLPTHRRRGLLTQLMRHQFADFRARGEPLAVLWASESGIYPRFGYGQATTSLRYQLARGVAFLPSSAVVAAGVHAAQHVRLVSSAKVASTIAPVYEAARPHRPGMSARSPAWWSRRTNHPDRFWVTVEGQGGPVAYAGYGVGRAWGDSGPAHTVHVHEMVSLTPEGEVGLWRYLLDLDLVTTVAAGGRPPDDALPSMLADARAIDRRLSDGMWLRLVDLPGALVARRYRAEGSAVLEVADPFIPSNAGRWRLVAGREPACVPAGDAAPDLVLDVSDLASVYLGGGSLEVLRRAGRVDERQPGAAARADGLFGWTPAPWGVTWF